MNKRGQIAIFVIVALVIVGAVIVIFAYPQLSTLIAPKEINPEDYLRTCIEPNVKSAVDLLAKQGGEENPVGFINYLDVNVKYLCYTSEYYKTCTVQQPLLITRFGKEASRMLTTKANQCARNLITEYEKRGYSVSSSTITSNISIVSGKIKIEFSAPMTITREDYSKTFDRFDASTSSEMYNLLSIATSILDYETTYGDSATELYLNYYPNLKIEKIKLEDGVKIYKLTNVVTKEIFQFATRSLVWPPGYGLE